MATNVARTFNRGTYFACMIVTWEISCLKNGFIKGGTSAKNISVRAEW